jgi:tRNA-dihydrouridine synthase A
VLARYERYVARELAHGTPLKTMTRHLLGMRSGRAGGRVWRRALGQLEEGAHGLAALRRLVETFALAPAFSPS